jgi:hypothetical protein
MQVVTPGVSLPFEITAPDGNLGATPALKIYDVTTGTPSLVSTTAMVHIVNGTYWASFTPSDGRSYIASTAFYTDPGIWNNLDQTYSSGSASFHAGMDLLSSRAV